MNTVTTMYVKNTKLMTKNILIIVPKDFFG